MRKLLSGFIIALTVFQANAQHYMGIATSNWSGTNSLYLNPANIADNRDKISIDILSVGAGLDNSLGTLNASNIYNKLRNEGGVNINDVFSYSNNKQFSMIAPYAEVRGPGILISINHRNSIAITTRVRVFNEFTNFDQSLFRTVNDPNFSASTDYNLTSKNFNWTAQFWKEVGITYGTVLIEKSKHQLKAGLTLRLLSSAGYLTIKGQNLDAHFYAANDSLVANKTDIQYSSNLLNNQNSLNSGLSSSDVLNNNSSGSGIGIDIGVVYEYRPDYPRDYSYEMDGKSDNLDYSKNMYKIRASLSITDIGHISYNNGNFVTNFNGNGYLSANSIASTQFNNFNDFRNYAVSHGFTLDTFYGKTAVSLPTMIIGGIDYHINKGFYANVTYMGNLVNRANGGISYYDQCTLTPRYDTKRFTIAVPFTYSLMTNSMKVGFGLRYSGFFIGSDDALAVVNDHQYGFNIYAGGYVPIGKKKLRDRDHDLVSDRYDLCPGIPGSPTAHGCPDRDGDSVADKFDRCPDIAGPVELNGCPDRDDDGVPDIDDKCPDVAGLAIFNGCPDTDGDGIPDDEDACPDKAGPAQFHGCPDTDKDGIPDNLDKCPTEWGPASNQGCPVRKEVREEVKAKLAFAATAIQFETGKAVLLASSYSILDEIVKIMQEYHEYNMTIDGYTDNVGSSGENNILSENRAVAVKNYLFVHGIAPDRLFAKGHGDSDPVATNDTEEGRAKNRRVALDLKAKK